MSSLIDLLEERDVETLHIKHTVCIRTSVWEWNMLWFVAILTVINFAIKFIPWNFLKRKLESEASRCSFASSSSSSSFMPVGSNNRKPLWGWDGFCRPERPLIPVACEVWNSLMPGWCAKGSAYWQTRAKLGKDGGRGLSLHSQKKYRHGKYGLSQREGIELATL